MSYRNLIQLNFEKEILNVKVMKYVFSGVLTKEEKRNKKSLNPNARRTKNSKTVPIKDQENPDDPMIMNEIEYNGERKIFHCSVCPKRKYSSKTALQHHIKNKHKGSPKCHIKTIHKADGKFIS